MSRPLLQINALRVETVPDPRSGPAPAVILKGIGLTLDRGQVLGLIGESGAGKSTVGHAAMG